MNHASSGWLAGDHRMNQRLRPLTCLLTLAVFAAWSPDALARANHKHQAAKKPHEAAARHHHSAALRKAGHSKHEAAKHEPARSGDVRPPAAEVAPLSGDLAAIKDAIDLARKGKTADATTMQKTIGD